MMRSKYLGLLSMTLLTLVSCSKEEKLSGLVIDPSTEKGVYLATISYNGYKSGKTKTKTDGTFVINALQSKKYNEVRLALNPEDNEDILSRYFIPKNQTQMVSVSDKGSAVEFMAYEWVDGNIVFEDKNILPPLGYDYLEYAVFSDLMLPNNDVTIKRVVPFQNNKLVKDNLLRGKMYINGKVYFLDGTHRDFEDSVFIPKSVSTSFSWKVKF